MRKKTSAAIAGLAITGLGLVMWPSAADAHHPEIEVGFVCVEPSDSLISITAEAWKTWDDGTLVTDDRRYNPDVRVEISNASTGWTEIGRGQFVPGNGFEFSVNTVQPNSAGVLKIRVHTVAPWGPNGEYNSLGDTRETSVDISRNCLPFDAPVTAPSITADASSTSDKVPTNGVTIVRDFPATPIEKLPKFTG